MTDIRITHDNIADYPIGTKLICFWGAMYPWEEAMVVGHIVKPASKFFPDKNRASEVAVWGMESWYLTNVLFITEGIFDAARLTELGVSAIAMAANDLDKTTARWLSTVRRFRPVVAVCDGDKAGRRLAKQGHVSIIMPDGTDLGGASDSFVADLLKEYGKSKSKTSHRLFARDS